MLDVRVLREAERQLTVCNACRYCEGVCPVFPALERLRTVTPGDIAYLGSLCHDCRDCYEVCPYSPPHELDINIPRVMAEVREQTYAAYSVPRLMGRLVMHPGRFAALVTLLALVVVIGSVTLLNPDSLFGERTGPGAFYEVVPWLAMVVPAMALSIYGVAVIAIGLARYWRELDRSLGAGFHARAVASAAADVMALRQMRGGGPGCTYPDDRPSHARVVYHQLVFYGFLLTLASTTMAAFTQEILGILPPYPILSPIVISGTLGGIAQVAGCLGLIALKVRATTVPASPPMRKLDFAFLGMVLAVNLTGLLLLLLRDTAAMGLLLAIHLGTVAGFFITLPYGKFVHAGYRYAALVRNRRDERAEELARA